MVIKVVFNIYIYIYVKLSHACPINTTITTTKNNITKYTEQVRSSTGSG